MLQLGNLVFKGKYDDIVGTALLFEPKPGGVSVANVPHQLSKEFSPRFPVEQKVEYVAKAYKKLSMARVILKRNQ